MMSAAMMMSAPPKCCENFSTFLFITWLLLVIPKHFSGLGRAVCQLRVGLCVWTITLGLNYVSPRYLACWFALTLSRWKSEAKVIGQSSRSHWQSVPFSPVGACYKVMYTFRVAWEQHQTWTQHLHNVKPLNYCWGTGMVICLEWGANDLHMVQLMLLPPHHLLLQQNPEWFTFLVPAYPGCPWKKAPKQM